MESVRISELKRSLKNKQYKKLDDFWMFLESRGGPLIETIENDDKNSLITYIYKGDEKTNNVVVVQPIGNRNPMDNMMNRVLDTDLWYKTYKVRNDVRFRYYFSVNDALDDDFSKRIRGGVHDKFNDNKLVFGDGHAISYVVMNKAEEHRNFNEVVDDIRGQLNKYEIFSKSLNEVKNVWVDTPCGYGEEHGIALFTDGKEHIGILKTKDILDNMIEEKRIKPIIGVFIKSTENRGAELRCNEDFEFFIIDELIPWIECNYKISKDSRDNVICGFSLGGLAALYIALKHPEIFRNVVSQSGAYHSSMEKIEKEIYRSENALRCYINVGILEDEKLMINKNIEVVKMLKEKRHFTYYEEFKGGHDYLCWGEGLFRGLNWVLQN